MPKKHASRKTLHAYNMDMVEIHLQRPAKRIFNGPIRATPVLCQDTRAPLYRRFTSRGGADPQLLHARRVTLLGSSHVVQVHNAEAATLDAATFSRNRHFLKRCRRLCPAPDSFGRVPSSLLSAVVSGTRFMSSAPSVPGGQAMEGSETASLWPTNSSCFAWVQMSKNDAWSDADAFSTMCFGHLCSIAAGNRQGVVVT